MVDWFERITGFREAAYDRTQAQLSVVDGRLSSTHAPTRWRVGELTEVAPEIRSS